MKLATLLLLTLFSSVLSAQTGETVHFNESRSVHELILDTGHLYAATDGGLAILNTADNSYDIFVPANSGLKDSQVKAIDVDEDQGVWVGTAAGGLFRFDGTSWEEHNDLTAGVTSYRFNAIDHLGDGRTIVHMDYLDPAYEPHLFILEDTGWEEIPDTPPGVVDICIDANGFLYGLFEDLLLYYNGQAWSSVNTGINLNQADPKSITADEAGNIWLSLVNDAAGPPVKMYRFNGTTWDDLTSEFPLPYNITPTIIGHPQADSSIWFFIDDSVVVHKNQELNYYQASDLSLPNHILPPSSFLIQNPDTWWLSGSPGPANPKPTLYQRASGTWTANALSRNSSFHNSGVRIVFDSLGRAWTNTHAGIQFFDGTDWTLFTPENSGMPTPWPSYTSLPIAVHPDGSIWGTGPDQVFRFDGTTWTYPADSAPNAPPLDNGIILSLAIDQDGKVYCGAFDNTANSPSLHIYDNGVWTAYTTTNSPIEKPFKEIAIGPDGTLWMTFSFDYAVRALRPDGSWKEFSQINSSLPNTEFNKISFDNTGAVFITTAWTGQLFKFEGSWEEVLIDDGNLELGNPGQLRQDYLGDYWLLSGSRVIRFNDNSYEVFDQNNTDLYAGFTSINIDHAGNFWLGSAYRGIHIFNPDSISVTPLPDRYLVNGKVFFDADEDGGEDPGESGMAGQHLYILPDSIHAYTQLSGSFQGLHLPGDYTYELIPPQGWQVSSSDNPFAVEIIDQDVEGIDFGLAPETSQISVETSLTSSVPVCHLNSSYWYSYTNTGTEIIDPLITIGSPAAFIFQDAFPIPDLIIGDTLIWYPDPLLPFENALIKIRYLMPAPDHPDFADTLATQAWIDFDGQILTDSLLQIVTCSYDPNDKMVRTESNYWGDSIITNETLTYTVRFQNLGNGHASRVIIRDQLATDVLDPTSFHLIASSHVVNTFLNTEGMLEFRFTDIDLPPAELDEAGSQGFVQFSLDQHPDLSPGVVIRNNADIYFDLNPPVRTNTIESVIIEEEIPVNEQAFPDRQEREMLVFPNPAEEQFFLSLPGSTVQLPYNIYNQLGQKVQSGIFSGPGMVIKCDQLPQGWYWVSIKEKEGQYTAKLLIQ